MRTAVFLLGIGSIGLGMTAALRPLRAQIAGQMWASADAGQAQGGPDAPMPVLTDTPEYCAFLEKRVLAQPKRPPEVKPLLLEGHRLCDHGRVREGIAQLRRALLMAKHKGPAVVVP